MSLRAIREISTPNSISFLPSLPSKDSLFSRCFESSGVAFWIAEVSDRQSFNTTFSLSSNKKSGFFDSRQRGGSKRASSVGVGVVRDAEKEESERTTFVELVLNDFAEK